MKMPRLRKGQSLVEFAVIFPAILLMVLVLVDLGRMVLAYSTINTAVREGTRMAVVGRSDADIDTRIMNICIITLKNFTVSDIKIVAAGTATVPKKRITINYTFIPFIRIIPVITFPLKVQSEMFVAPLYK